MDERLEAFTADPDWAAEHGAALAEDMLADPASIGVAHRLLTDLRLVVEEAASSEAAADTHPDLARLEALIGQTLEGIAERELDGTAIPAADPDLVEVASGRVAQAAASPRMPGGAPPSRDHSASHAPRSGASMEPAPRSPSRRARPWLRSPGPRLALAAAAAVALLLGARTILLPVPQDTAPPPLASAPTEVTVRSNRLLGEAGPRPVAARASVDADSPLRVRAALDATLQVRVQTASAPGASSSAPPFRHLYVVARAGAAPPRVAGASLDAAALAALRRGGTWTVELRPVGADTPRGPHADAARDAGGADAELSDTGIVLRFPVRGLPSGAPPRQLRLLASAAPLALPAAAAFAPEPPAGVLRSQTVEVHPPAGP